jgi:hypothetical protein
MGVSEGENRKNGKKSIFEAIMAQTSKSEEGYEY